MMSPMSAALLLLLLAAALGIRSVLRRRCLGKCAACPHRRACALSHSMESKKAPLSDAVAQGQH